MRRSLTVKMNSQRQQLQQIQRISALQNNSFHMCGNRHLLSSKMLSCKFCHQEILFDGDEYVCKSGKTIPLDSDMELHTHVKSLNAWHKTHPLLSRYCNNAEIYFDNNIVSADGKQTLLEAHSKPHDCPKCPHYAKKVNGNFRELINKWRKKKKKCYPVEYHETAYEYYHISDITISLSVIGSNIGAIQ